MSEQWVNPYQVTKRGADTLNLVSERRLQTRLITLEVGAAPIRQWRFVGGSPGSWADAAREWAQRYLDAGLIAHTSELSFSDWAMVHRTPAGVALMDAWREHPFTVVDATDTDTRAED